LPSSRSELIEKDIRQKPGSAGLFSFQRRLAPQVVACNALASVVLLDTILTDLKRGERSRLRCFFVRAAPPMTSNVKLDRLCRPKGYPVRLRKKMRACLVTYRHSGEQQFEKQQAALTNVTDL
jgi:hypothetical protein